jgi:hypothetical protein
MNRRLQPLLTNRKVSSRKRSQPALKHVVKSQPLDWRFTKRRRLLRSNNPRLEALRAGCWHDPEPGTGQTGRSSKGSGLAPEPGLVAPCDHAAARGSLVAVNDDDVALTSHWPPANNCPTVTPAMTRRARWRTRTRRQDSYASVRLVPERVECAAASKKVLDRFSGAALGVVQTVRRIGVSADDVGRWAR